MTQIHPEHSPNETVTAHQGANVNVNRFMLPKDPWQLGTAVLLALSVAVNLWCWMAIREAGTESRLQQYNLDWFKTHEFSDLKGEVEVNQKLITAFGPQCKR